MANVQQLVTEHIDVWTSAIEKKSATGRGSKKKIRLQGILKLRELILELAVRGKLVSQDPSDEHASVVLKKIAKEKTKLLDEGKLNVRKIAPVITDEEKPFDVPNGWVWARFPDVSDYKPGKTPSTKNPVYWSDSSDDYPWVSISDMDHFGKVSDTTKKITQEAVDQVFKHSPIPAGSLVMSFKLTVGKIAILGVDAFHNEAIISIQPFTGINRDYLFKFLPTRALAGNTKRAIMGNTLNATSLSLLLIPIPPLAEQHRIVAKVDELMALCDQLEQQTENSITAHQTLVETLLTTLTNSANAEELQQNWARIETHFDTLFTTEHSIDQLKQTILQLAVMGKLVPQDPNDEPASVLLEKIAEEKARLVEEGKIKKQKALSEITEKEIPFDLPLGWGWAKVDRFSHKITDGEHFRPQTQSDGVYFLSAKDIREDGVSLTAPLYVSQETAEKALQRCDPERGDILIVSRGATVGRMCTVDIDDVFCLLGSVILIKPVLPILSDYLKIVMKSPHIFERLVSASGSTAQPAIYLRDLKKIMFPIAPLAEQHRIVAKVDELMALCDSLKARITEAQTTQVHLANAIVEQAVS